MSIDPLATGGKEDGLAYHTAPESPMAHLKPSEYYPDLLEEGPRKDLKPLHMSQPEGPSFTVDDGNCISWQKWQFRVGFNYREGTTIHDVRYDRRPLFYRLSVSEMTVPYGGKLAVNDTQPLKLKLPRSSKSVPSKASVRPGRCRSRKHGQQSWSRMRLSRNHQVPVRVAK